MEETSAFNEVGVVGCLGWGIRSFSVSSVISVVRTSWLRPAAASGDSCHSLLPGGRCWHPAFRRTAAFAALRVPVLVSKPSSQELDELRFSPPLPS